jgi:Secretion system C-terminal sorting domain
MKKILLPIFLFFLVTLTSMGQRFELIHQSQDNSTRSNIEDINGNDIYVYPNPARTQLNLVFGEMDANSAKLVIRNFLGSEVLSQKIDLKGNFENIDISDLNNGIYLYSLVVGGSPIVTKKFTVRK